MGFGAQLKKTPLKYMIMFIKKIRAIISRFIKPKEKHILFGGPARKLNPISNKFGFDRGLPIDRFYVEKFLNAHKDSIKGRCLEVVNNEYTVKFGESRVTQSDVVDNNPNNARATIHGDLRDLTEVSDNIYDTLIITQTLGMIDNIGAVTKELHRILKPGGTLLVTATTLGPLWEQVFWRLTPSSLQFIFEKYFQKFHIETFGNVFVQQCFLSGFAAEELDAKELNFNDARFPLVLGFKAIK